MGGSQSVEIPGGGTEGYHVLKVQEHSPGHKAGLEAYFDFIVAIGNTRLNQNDDRLKEILKNSIDKPLKLLVYNSKHQKVREVELTPNNKWGGQGLLGVSIRFASFDGANENVWHVLDIAPNSPADVAGLQSNTDYIIGADSMIQDNDDLYNLVSNYEGKPLKLFVYSSLHDNCREVTIIPNSQWGGNGCLGCDIGYGYLHRIPEPTNITSSHSISHQVQEPAPNNIYPLLTDFDKQPSSMAPSAQQSTVQIPLSGDNGSITKQFEKLSATSAMETVIPSTTTTTTAFTADYSKIQTLSPTTIETPTIPSMLPTETQNVTKLPLTTTDSSTHFSQIPMGVNVPFSSAAQPQLSHAYKPPGSGFYSVPYSTQYNQFGSVPPLPQTSAFSGQTYSSTTGSTILPFMASTSITGVSSPPLSVLPNMPKSTEIGNLIHSFSSSMQINGNNNNATSTIATIPPFPSMNATNIESTPTIMSSGQPMLSTPMSRPPMVNLTSPYGTGMSTAIGSFSSPTNPYGAVLPQTTGVSIFNPMTSPSIPSYTSSQTGALPVSGSNVPPPPPQTSVYQPQPNYGQN
ncbi:hypothetical protein RDWZM_001187 [Blomia tropicalis]|uniref:PDZ GRASP-type domain-containing protein n=1 Tax=Blomia tropicalis TaxID=40697 RepID=A0A9Q0MDT6_BLOTA|nr:hypothetical protein RDWZM_001187 [Blomia tropicalis]